MPKPLHLTGATLLSHLWSLSYVPHCCCVVVQRCVRLPHPLSTALQTPRMPLEKTNLKSRQPLPAGQTQTRRPQKVHPKVES